MSPVGGLGATRRTVLYPALREAVDVELKRRHWPADEAAQALHVDKRSLNDVGTRRLTGRMIHALSALGFSEAQIHQLEAGAGSSGYDPITLRIASVCAQMPLWKRELVLQLARDVAAHPVQTD